MKLKNTILVTGGAGFIGSNFILNWIKKSGGKVVNLDLLTYAGNAHNLDDLASNPQYAFIKGDICDYDLLAKLLTEHTPRAIINFAAESHVDRSISNPDSFIHTNILGTFALLKAAHHYWSNLSVEEKARFRFIQIGTDEVYGSLEHADPAFREKSPYQPSSPYSASKASSDHLVKAWHSTYGLPAIVTNCSNNYGPLQFPEKLIPLVITNALAGKRLPIYGDGQNIRDWIFVQDHCDAIEIVLNSGRTGESYNIGGNAEKTNLEVVKTICSILDKLAPPTHTNLLRHETSKQLTSYNELITFVADRPGHDRRYAIDSSKMLREFHWTPKESFDTGIAKTVAWYISNRDWVTQVQQR